MFAEEKDIIEETMRLAAERETAREAYEAEHGPKKWGVYLPEEIGRASCRERVSA